MLNVTVRFILAALKLVFKITLVLGGVVVSSLGNACQAIRSGGVDHEDNSNSCDSMKGFVQDEQSAMSELTRGNLSEGQMGNYWGIGEKN